MKPIAVILLALMATGAQAQSPSPRHCLDSDTKCWTDQMQAVRPLDCGISPSDICDGKHPSLYGMETPLGTPPDRSWHLLTQSYGGTVSLLKDLTKTECEHIKYQVMLWTPPPVYPGTIMHTECFQ